MCRRRAEENEDLIPDVFLDRAAFCERNGAYLLEGVSESSSHPLRAEPLTEIGRAHHVDEDARDETTL
jgi:hypothetical protein